MYAWNVDGNSSEVSYNRIHDNFAALSGAGIYLDDGCANFIAHHNVIWRCMEGMRLGHIDAATGHCIYNNTFWGLTSVAMAQHGSAALTNVKTYNNLSDHAEFIGTDLQRNICTTRNQFVNPAAGDFHLAAGSVAIDTGISIPGITVSVAGRAPDAGAYEFGGADWAAGTPGDSVTVQKPGKSKGIRVRAQPPMPGRIFDMRGRRITPAREHSFFFLRRSVNEPAPGIYFCEFTADAEGLPAAREWISMRVCGN